MVGRAHHAVQHRSALPGIEALSLVSDRGFPRHAHDHFGIGVIAFGEHRSWSGLGQVEAGPGDVIAVNPGEIHDGLPVDGQARGWRMLYVDPAVMARAALQDIRGEAEITRPAASDPPLAALLARAFAGVTAAMPDRLEVEEDLLRVLMHLLRRHGVRGPVGRGPSPPVAQALRRLDDAPEVPVSLAELAAASGVSRFQLLRGFHREVGATPHAYLTQRRVRLAQALLAAGRRPAEAAVEAGFADQSHLNRAFVRQLGVTPGRYRAATAAISSKTPRAHGCH